MFGESSIRSQIEGQVANVQDEATKLQNRMTKLLKSRIKF